MGCVTDRPCPLDGVALRDAEVICSGCVGRARGDLRAVPELLRELDLALSRQTSMPPGAGVGGCPQGCLHGPDDGWCVQGATVPLDVRASAARTALLTLLHGWVRVWLEELPEREPYDGPRCARGERWLCTHPSCRAAGLWALRAAVDDVATTPAGQAGLLASRPWGTRPWAAELAVDVRDAVTEGERAIDRPAEASIVGRCQACGSTVYAPPEALQVRCRACGERAGREDVREASLAESRKLVTATQMGTALTNGDAEAARKMTARVWQWRKRGRIGVVRHDIDGRPLYRISDGQRLLQQQDDDQEEETCQT
jgi:uncharacterized OB-fold protein